MKKYKTNIYKDVPQRKFCMFLFNRASYGRTKALIQAMERTEWIDITLCLSSSLLDADFGRPENYIRESHEDAEIVSLDIDHKDKSHYGMAMASSDILAKISTFLSNRKYDAVFVVADRFETLPAAIAASYQNIPIIHIQGGEVTGNIDERVRHAVTKLSDYHFVSTELARSYVKDMGEFDNRVFRVGCPSLDLMKNIQLKRTPVKKRYAICIFHPETECSNEAFEQTRIVMEAVIEWCAQTSATCTWFWPNPDPGREDIIAYLDEALKKYGHYLDKAINETPEQFLWRLAGSRLIVGNSSCGLRESSFLGVPSVNIGDRQHIRERAVNTLDARFDVDEIIKVMKRQDETYRYMKSDLFGVTRAAPSIIDRLSRLDLTLKPAIKYPYSIDYRERHFGEDRFHGRYKKRYQTKHKDLLKSA